MTWYVAVGMTTAGYKGVNGIMERQKAGIHLFATYYLVQGILIIIISGVDFGYVNFCDHLPDSALHILYALVPEKMNLLYKLGHDPSKAPPSDLNGVLGTFAMTLIPVTRVLAIVFSFYIAQQASALAEVAAGGPCGLGPMYGLDIGSDLHREWKHCVDDMMEGRQAMVKGGPVSDCLPISNLKRAGVLPPAGQSAIDYVKHGSLYENDYKGYGTLA
jgi:hypothetical protein